MESRSPPPFTHPRAAADFRRCSPRRPIERDLEIAGPIKLMLHASSTRTDTDFFVKLAEQMPQSTEDRTRGLNPPSQPVSKGWLRASHRALDPKHSDGHEPYHSHVKPEPIVPGQAYKLEIGIEPMAYQFKKGSRIRVEIANGDSSVTDMIWTHLYQPDKIGEDTIHHSARLPSVLVLPVTG
jgi:predicted acyl esterase